jgi:3-oxoacyl-[acyl-carrier protein] reductase
VGQFNVNVNAVAFGLIDTRLTVVRAEDTSIEIDGRTISVGLPEHARSTLAGMIPLGRTGRASEAAGGIAFLCSPWSDYVTGQVLNVTGGIQMGMAS